LWFPGPSPVPSTGYRWGDGKEALMMDLRDLGREVPISLGLVLVIVAALLI